MGIGICHLPISHLQLTLTLGHFDFVGFWVYSCLALVLALGFGSSRAATGHSAGSFCTYRHSRLGLSCAYAKHTPAYMLHATKRNKGPFIGRGEWWLNFQL